MTAQTIPLLKRNGLSSGSLALMAVLSGCIPGVDPVAPELSTTAHGVANPALSKAYAAVPAEEKWWMAVEAPDLHQMLEEVLQANAQLGRLAARLEEMQILAEGQVAQSQPSVEAGVGYQRTRQAPFSTRIPLNPNASGYRAAATATYEWDLWGRLKAAQEAARADARTAEAELAALRLSLSLETAKLYFTWMDRLRELENMRAQLAWSLAGLEIYRKLVEQGVANEADLLFRQARHEEMTAREKTVEREVANCRHRWLVLSGGSRWEPQPSPSFAHWPDVSAWQAVTEDFLRRPDVRAATAAWEASVARIGEAKAAFYPSLRLSASLGTDSREWENWFDLESRFFSLAANLTAPIWNGRKNQSRLNAARVRAIQAAEQLRDTWWQAIREFKDAAVALADLESQRQDWQCSLAAVENALALARARYQAGLTNYLEVIFHESSRLQSSRMLEVIDYQTQLARIDLVGAAGGTLHVRKNSGTIIP